MKLCTAQQQKVMNRVMNKAKLLKRESNVLIEAYLGKFKTDRAHSKNFSLFNKQAFIKIFFYILLFDSIDSNL